MSYSFDKGIITPKLWLDYMTDEDKAPWLARLAAMHLDANDIAYIVASEPAHAVCYHRNANGLPHVAAGCPTHQPGARYDDLCVARVDIPAIERNLDRLIPQITATLNALQFVEWDRHVGHIDLTDGTGALWVYGWINRTTIGALAGPDRDFVALWWSIENHELADEPGYISSSAAYTHRLSEILYGSVSTHIDCRTLSGSDVEHLAPWQRSA